jgi:hypothetical protein
LGRGCRLLVVVMVGLVRAEAPSKRCCLFADDMFGYSDVLLGVH